jgi:hypothetical protein
MTAAALREAEIKRSRRKFCGNIPMLKVFEKSGLPVDVRLEPEGVQ